MGEVRGVGEGRARSWEALENQGRVPRGRANWGARLKTTLFAEPIEED